MNDTASNLKPILVGFSLPKDLNELIFEINASLDTSKIDFNNRIPHVTLWMGFVKTKQLASLNLGLRKIFRNISIETDLGSLETFESQFGKVCSWELKNVRPLYLLQNRIHHFFEPFREKSEGYDDFTPETIDYINNFSTKSLDNYSPHITIGFGEECHSQDFEGKVILNDPKMFSIANYCTCETEIQ